MPDSAENTSAENTATVCNVIDVGASKIGVIDKRKRREEKDCDEGAYKCLNERREPGFGIGLKHTCQQRQRPKHYKAADCSKGQTSCEKPDDEDVGFGLDL